MLITMCVLSHSFMATASKGQMTVMCIKFISTPCDVSLLDHQTCVW